MQEVSGSVLFERAKPELFLQPYIVVSALDGRFGGGYATHVMFRGVPDREYEAEMELVEMRGGRYIYRLDLLMGFSSTPAARQLFQKLSQKELDRYWQR